VPFGHLLKASSGLVWLEMPSCNRSFLAVVGTRPFKKYQVIVVYRHLADLLIDLIPYQPVVPPPTKQENV